MKKLLSLLSVLTISGSAVPTTIAASSYQKEKNLNNYFNNLVKFESKKYTIIRSKRDNNNEKIINKIKNTSLGIISDNRNTSILQAIARLNPDVDISNLRVSSSFLSYALIADITGDTIFVNYITTNISSSITFRQSIRNTNLGILPNNNNTNILNRFCELNPNIQRKKQHLFITEITNKNAIISDKNKRDKVYVNFNVHKENFRKRFNNRNLGTIINIDKDNINEDLIKNRICELNPNISEDELEITGIEEINNTLRVSLISLNELNSQNFNVDEENAEVENNILENFLESNEVSCDLNINSNLKHNWTAPIRIESILRNRNLGILPNNNPDTILQAIARLNPLLNVENLVLLNIGQRSARVQFNEGTSASTDLSFLVYFSQQAQEVELCNSIRNIILKELRNDNNNVIKSKIAASVPGINKDNLSIISRTPTKILVKSPNGRICYGGTLNINVRNNDQINLLESIIINRNLGEINDNSNTSILQALVRVNPGIDSKMLMVESASENSAIIIGRLRSSYRGSVVVNYTIRPKPTTKNNNKNINVQNEQIKNNNKKIIDKYNSLSKEEKQNKLNEIHEHYQSLPKNKQKEFKDKLRDTGLALTSVGISGAGILGVSKMTGISPIKGLSTSANYIKNSLSLSTTNTAASTGEAVEMMPLLSESALPESLTAVETLSVVEETAVIGTEGAVIGTEAGTALSLAPETLGLSLLIGGLIIAGTAILWWVNHDNTTVTKHESHNQYNGIEKYYKFLAHDQLKLDISISEWNKIKQIYQENLNNYQEFKNKIKSEITSFHKEDHSGWGNSIIDEDINTLINILYNHFQEINNHFSSNPNHGWKIVTNTAGNYFIIEEE